MVRVENAGGRETLSYVDATGPIPLVTENMFLAVAPPPDVIQIIDDLPTRALRGVKYTRRHQWHVTLRYLGASDPDAAIAALDSIEASEADAALGPEVSLLGNRVVMIPVAGLDELAGHVTERFAGVGEPQEERPFRGHLTLARLKGAPLRNPSSVAVLGAPITATFRAFSVALIKTELTPDGSVHTLVAEKDLLP